MHNENENYKTIALIEITCPIFVYTSYSNELILPVLFEQNHNFSEYNIIGAHRFKYTKIFSEKLYNFSYP